MKKFIVAFVFLLFAIARADTYSTVILATSPSPVLYYRMDATTTGSAADDLNLGSTGSGSGRDIVYHNTPTVGVTGIPAVTDKAVAFLGSSSQYGSTSGNFSGQGWCGTSSDCSFEAWVDSTSGIAGGNIFESGGDLGGNNFAFQLYGGAGAGCTAGGGCIGQGTIWTSGGANVISYVGTTTYSAGSFHHLFMMYDHTAIQLKLCVDGAADATGTVTGSGTANNIGNNVFIGGRGDLTGFITASVDEVALYTSKFSMSCTTAASHHSAGISSSNGSSSGFLLEGRLDAPPRFTDGNYYSVFVDRGYNTNQVTTVPRLFRLFLAGDIKLDGDTVRNPTGNFLWARR